MRYCNSVRQRFAPAAYRTLSLGQRWRINFCSRNGTSSLVVRYKQCLSHTCSGESAFIADGEWDGIGLEARQHR